jgi:hypothetical protein
MRAASLSLGFRWCFVAFGAFGACAAFGCAGGNKAVVGASMDDDAGAETIEHAAPSDAGSRDAAADAAPAPAAEEQAPPVVDPAVSHALLAKTGEAEGSTPLGLRFEIVELGSELPWAFAIVNRGTEAAQVDFDARLLTLEIAPPADSKSDAKGKAKPKQKPVKPVICRLPGDVVPSSVDPALASKLEPGDGLVTNFDPRLYCLGKTPNPLVQGAVVSPRFGWAPKLKVSWHGGKREEAPGKQSEPFVAEPIEAHGSLPANGGDTSERRIKELSGTPLTLGSDFATGRHASPDDAPPPDPSGLELGITGGDATDEGATVTTATFTNRGKQKQDLYFRRELITYEVSGPDGVFQCDPEPDQRSPDRSAFQTLRPGGKFSAVSRLIEMCPAHSFARPGLYLVHARFDAVDAGTEYGLHAFMGRLLSQKPALVRVREGELPFTPSNGTARVHVGE